MNSDQITGIIRAVAPAALAYAVGKGWITQSQVGDIVAGLVAIGSAAWSFSNNKTGKVIS